MKTLDFPQAIYRIRYSSASDLLISLRGEGLGPQN